VAAGADAKDAAVLDLLRLEFDYNALALGPVCVADPSTAPPLHLNGAPVSAAEWLAAFDALDDAAHAHALMHGDPSTGMSRTIGWDVVPDLLPRGVTLVPPTDRITVDQEEEDDPIEPDSENEEDVPELEVVA
jgi:hypothetical protein